MKGQPLMKHSNDLIGLSVLVYRQDWANPIQPRPGIITGFGVDKGLFGITIMHDHRLDMQRGLPPVGYLTNCLLVDDQDDTPIGVTEWARVRPEVWTQQEGRDITELVVDADIGTQGADDEPHEPDDADDADDADEPKAKAKAKAKAKKPAKDPEPKAPQRPAGTTPIGILMNTPGWDPIKDLPFKIESSMPAENEMVLNLPGDDRPIARMVYKYNTARENEIATDPFGFTIKLRDTAGRCSIVLAENIPDPANVDKAVKSLAKCLELANGGKLGDWGSAAANMMPAINEYNSQK